jgi:hypothetical protein
MWARQKKVPFEIRPVLKCQRMAATQLLKRKYGITPSVVRHTDDHLFKTARARVTFSRMSVAFAVQMKGLGF